MSKENLLKYLELNPYMVESDKKKFPSIVAKSFSLAIGTKKLVEPSNFSISNNEKIGLVGRNGAGKTTLLEVVNSICSHQPLPNSINVNGLLEVSTSTRIGYHPQDVQISHSGTVDDYLDSCAKETTLALKEFERLTALTSTNQSPENIKKIGEVMEKIEMLDGWNYQERKRRIIEGFGIDSSYLQRNVRNISGGEATKISLAGVLISKPNIILLDEPTNNLDFKSILFLERWIKEQKNIGFLIVSHDRVFLDNTVNSILEIDEEFLHILTFGGNYSFFYTEKEKIYATRMKDYEIAFRKWKSLGKEARRLQSNNSTFETTSPEAFFRSKGARLQKKALQLRKRAEKILEISPEPEPPKIPHIEVKEITPGKDRILYFSNLTFKYPNAEKELFRGVSFSLHQGERVVVIGPNGAGKTTFIKILTGELKPETTSFEINKRIRINYVPQNLFISNPRENLLTFSQRMFPGFEEDLRSLLGKVIFTDPSDVLVGNLSLGELKRVLFSVNFAQGPDLLILDEPVNHIDLYTAEMLDTALEKYRGALIVISHDRYFLQRLNARRLLVVDKGSITEREIANQNDILTAFENI